MTCTKWGTHSMFSIIEHSQRLCPDSSSLCSFSSPQPASHTLFVSLHNIVSFTQPLMLLTSAQMNTHAHAHSFLNGVMAGSLEIWGWMRLDGDCPTYHCYPSPQTGRGHGLPLCSLPVSSALSVLTGWHVHSCLLPPAAAYSKAHTSLWFSTSVTSSFKLDFEW